MADEIKPNGRNSWHDLIDILSALLTRDNLVILSLTVIVMYAIYMFGEKQSVLAKEIIIYVAGGLTGYLGNAVVNR